MVPKNTVLKFRKPLESAKYHSRAICLNFSSIKTSPLHPVSPPATSSVNIANGLEVVEMILVQVSLVLHIVINKWWSNLDTRCPFNSVSLNISLFSASIQHIPLNIHYNSLSTWLVGQNHWRRRHRSHARRKRKSWLMAKYQAELAEPSSEKKQGLCKVCMDVQKAYLKEMGRVISLNHNTLTTSRIHGKIWHVWHVVTGLSHWLYKRIRKARKWLARLREVLPTTQASRCFKNLV